MGKYFQCVISLSFESIWNLLKLQQAVIREYSWKIPVEERTNFFVKNPMEEIANLSMK